MLLRRRESCCGAPSRGFTLVELLVVIAIIGILVALLLPAVQAAREASRRSSCSNNLKQIGLAVHNYHDTFNAFPPANHTPGACCGTPSYTNWAISILPFLENNPLHDQYNHTLFNEDPTNKLVREALVKTYACPSEPGTDRLEFPESGPGAGLQYRPGSYRAMNGRSDGNGWFDNSDYTNLPAHFKGVLHTIGVNGLECERFGSILDGSSNTFLVGEYGTKTNPRRRTFWAYAYTSYSNSSAVPESRALLNDYNRCVTIGGAGGSNTCKRAWGSFHPGGVMFVLCDGSVRFLSRTIDLNVFAGAATIAGSESANLPN
ncbi:MAG: DUF1559 domain-containing protein [Pirellulales bacterium]